MFKGGARAGVGIEGEVLGGGIRAGVEIIPKFAAPLCPPCLLGGGSNRSPNSCSTESAGCTLSGYVQCWFMEHAPTAPFQPPPTSLIIFSRANTKGSEGTLSPQSLCHSGWFWREKNMSAYVTSFHFCSHLKNNISCNKVS